ncbi:hypothetical protein BayCH28_18520 [Mycolicibacterium sp. CH28]|nr:hypothetical protein BayCH28_18520 [Mycolicibacterium sp. CH28]
MRISITTALAWQRTGIGAMAILVLVPRRYRRVVRAVHTGDTPLSRARVPSATLMLVTVGIGVELLRA